MKRIYHAYTKWEDYKHGMWKSPSKEDEDNLLAYAIVFTGDHIRYGKAMLRVIDAWPFSCEHNLTDNSMNQRAWIGHAAVAIELGIPEYITRLAWGHLTKQQQDLANAAADHAINTWKNAQKLLSTERL